MSHQRRARVLSLLMACVLFVGALPGVASASINDIPQAPVATTSTNPGVYEAPTWWRRNWGNSLMVNMNFKAPSPGEVEYGAPPEAYPALGFIYKINRTPFASATLMPPGFVDFTGSYIDTTTPTVYDHAYESIAESEFGALMSHSFDMNGIMNSDPVGLASLDPGARLPVEGIWWIHYNFFNEKMYANTTLNIPVGVDLTPPLPVSKINAKPYIGYSGAAGVWMPNTRAVVSWEHKEYDALSGTAAYEIYLNDVRLMDESTAETPQYVWHLPHTYSTFTMEDLPDGKNKITVKPVDRATNVGPGVSTYFYVDSDVPVLTITSPAAGGLVSKNGVFTATATDGAGIQYVQFYIDGKLIYTDATSPYSLSKDMSAYANGKHTLVVKTKDMLGREVSASRDFTLDKTPPTLSSVSDAPDPFYPNLKDGYKDYTTVSFTTNEAGYAYVYFYNDNGTLVAGRSRPIAGAGTYTITWTGDHNLADTVEAWNNSTYTYRVLMTDNAQNATLSGLGSTTRRDYELVRVADNAVKVIPR